MNHRISTAFMITIMIILIATFSGEARAQTINRYEIQLNSDRSATLTVAQVSGLNGTVDTLGGFQSKATSLVDAAVAQTNRQMSVDPNSIQITITSTSSDSKTTDYTFTWLNFTIAKGGQLVGGDVFAVSGFFNRLYGDGVLLISYPANYTCSVVPAPDQRDSVAQTLEWLNTQSFIAERPTITLTPQNSVQISSTQLPLNVIVPAAAVVAVAALIVGWFFVVSRRQKAKMQNPTGPFAPIETEEEKVLRLLRSSGGAVYQSAITEQFRFSKAKTSQLLSALERNGKVRRVKKGRDKIVNLIEQSKGEK